MSLKSKLKLAVVTRLASMIVITVFAILVMIAVNLKGRKIVQADQGAGFDSRPAMVTTQELVLSDVEISKKHSGIIKPFERYLLAFKTAGRIESLGKNENGKELDEGDRITKGMVLARLDTELLTAQKKELEVNRDFARSEYDKVANLNQNTISQSDLDRRKSAYDIAEAKLKVIQTQINDGILVSNIDGIISKRMVKPGESVNLGQTVFEVIQIDRVKLVVGVPESKIRRIITADQAAKSNRNSSASLHADITLIGKESGSVDQRTRNGNVHLVSQTSDDKSGLFEVEILINNQSLDLRPGMIAIADIVVEQVNAFKIPIDAVFFDEDKTYVFAVSEEPPERIQSGDSDKFQPQDGGEDSDGYTNIKFAKRVELTRFEIQGDYLVTSSLPEDSRNIIVGGHRRLVDGRKIKIVSNR